MAGVGAEVLKLGYCRVVWAVEWVLERVYGGMQPLALLVWITEWVLKRVYGGVQALVLLVFVACYLLAQGFRGDLVLKRVLHLCLGGGCIGGCGSRCFLQF